MRPRSAGLLLTVFVFAVLVLACGNTFMHCCSDFLAICSGVQAVPTSSFLTLTSGFFLAFLFGWLINFFLPAATQPRFLSFSPFDPKTRTVPLFLLNEVYRL